MRTSTIERTLIFLRTANTTGNDAYRVMLLMPIGGSVDPKEFHLIQSTYDDLPDKWMTMKQIRELRPHLSQDQLTLATSLNTMKLAFGTIVSIDKEDIDGFETLNVSDDDIRYDIRDRNFLIERLPGRQTCEPSWHRLTTIPLSPGKQPLLTPNDEK